MKRLHPLPSAEEVRAFMSYDPETGICRRLKDTRGAGKAGDVLGSRGKACLTTSYNGSTYILHQLIWVWMTGAPPRDYLFIDHANRDPHDNRWSNLRLARNCDNLRNRVTYNKLGLRGVQETPSGRFQASVGNTYIGTYNTAREAHRAWRLFARQEYGDFLCTKATTEKTSRVDRPGVDGHLGLW